MATVRDICTAAAQEIGAIGQGETLNAADAQLCLQRFQNQLDAWQAEQLTLFNFVRTIYTLPGGSQTRTIGPSGNITTPSNPVFLNGINYVVPGSDPAVETRMGRMDDDSFMMQSIKDLSSNLPTQWWFNRGETNGTLWFWPVETGDVEIAIYCYFGVGVPASLNDTIAGPPGYQEAFMYQLALRLMTPFARPAEAAPLLLGPNGFAAQSLARIKRTNLKPGLLGVDAALVPNSGGAYNVLNDTNTGYYGGR